MDNRIVDIFTEIDARLEHPPKIAYKVGQKLHITPVFKFAMTRDYRAQPMPRSGYYQVAAVHDLYLDVFSKQDENGTMNCEYQLPYAYAALCAIDPEIEPATLD